MAGWSHLGGRKGMVTGIVLSGYGAGGSLLSIYYNKEVDSMELNPKLDIRDGNWYFP